MELEGVVSLWTGQLKSASVLRRVLKVEFSPDGDFLGSEFSRAFGVEYYEDVSTESEYFEHPPGTLAGLLADCSYEAVILPLFLSSATAPQAVDNCAILIYDYQYSGSVPYWVENGVSLRFLGHVRYT